MSSKGSDLHEAAVSGDIDTFKSLLSDASAGDLNYEEEVDSYYYKVPSLSAAAILGHFDIVELILSSKKCNVDNGNSSAGETALSFASYYDQIEVVELLLKHGADVNATNNAGNSALMVAAMQGHVDVGRMLLQYGASCNQLNQYSLTTALILASYRNHYEFMQLLIIAGADTQVLNNDGWTAFMLATRRGHIEAIHVLVRAGADVLARNQKGSSMQQRLIRSAEAQELFDQLNDIFSAANDNNKEELIELLKNNAVYSDLNYVGKFEKWEVTALICAIMNQHEDIVQLLIQAGADVNCCMAMKISPLMTATAGNSVNIVKQLLQAGADVNHVTAYKKDVLSFSKNDKVRDVLTSWIDSNQQGKKIPSKLKKNFVGRIEIPEHLEQCLNDILPIQTISRSSGNTNSKGGASTSNNNAGTTATTGTADVAAKKEKVEEKKESIAAPTTPPTTTAPITAPITAPAPISTDVPTTTPTTTTASTDNALEMSLHVQRALQQGSKPWKRSKFSIVGEGRAGKTAFTNAIIGKSFQDTASTVGINQLTCNIKHIKTNDKPEKTESENDEQSWEECEKTERELENAIAELILNSQNNQKNNPTTTSNTTTINEKERKDKDIRTYMKSTMNNQKKSNREYDESDSDDPSEEEESDDEESDQEEKNNKRKNKKESSNQSKNKNNNTKIKNSSNQQNNDKKKTNSEQITKQQKKDKNNNTDKQLNNSTTNNKTKKEIIPTSMTKSNEIKSEDSKVEASRELDENTVMKMLATMKDKNSGLLISLFDFGGQSVFDIIHHLFLTRNGVYALVFNMEWLINDNQNEKQKALRFMRNWLSSIAVHTFNTTTKMTAPIVIVGTRLDKITNPSDHEKISTILHEHFSDNLAWRSVISNKDGKDSNGKALQWFFPVDNKAGSRSVGMKRLMTVVHEVINKAEYTHKEIPLTWLKVIDHMSDMKKDCLLLSDLKMLGERNGVSIEEVPYMLTFLHDVGHLMWLDEPGLRDVVILDPVSYLVTPATIIICKLTPDHDDTTHHFMECHHECERMHRREWMQLKRDGILHITLLPILWADFIAHQDVLLQLMVKFGLLVPLRSASTTTTHTTTTAAVAVITQYLVPTLLSPASLTDHNIINWTDQPYSTCYLVFTLVDDLEMSPNLTEADLHSAGFLPGGMFERMIGKSISWSQDTARSSNINIQNILLYKDIAILTFGRQRFRLIHCPDLHSIRVDIEGDHPIGIQQKLLSFALKIIDECMKSLHCFTSICYKTNLGPENEEVKSLKGLLSSELLIPLLQLRKASKGESMLAWRGGRTLLTLNEIKSKYKQWLQLFDLRERYDVFISYRWGEYDSDFTERLFDMFTNYSINTNNRAVEVFLDRKRLREGRQFKSDFSAALTHCSIALPIISIDALGRMVDHNPTYCDNVLLEWIIILECFAVKRLQKVYPILFGQREGATTVLPSNEVVVKDFFMHPIKDSLSTTIPVATLEQASTLLRENGIEPSGRFNAYTVNSIVQEMLLFLLCKASDYTSTIVVEAVADKVIVLLGDCVEVLASQKTTSSGATGSSTTNPTPTTTTTPPPTSTTTTKALKELNVDEVCILLEREGLTKLINIFREKEVTGAMLTFCESAEDLKGEEFGVPGAVMARGLMKLITQWQTEGVSV